MSKIMYNAEDSIVKDSVKVTKLKQGQQFVKVRNGIPATVVFRYEGEMGGMVKATRIKDNFPYLFKNYMLVLPFNA